MSRQEGNRSGRGRGRDRRVREQRDLQEAHGSRRQASQNRFLTNQLQLLGFSPLRPTHPPEWLNQRPPYQNSIQTTVPGPRTGEETVHQLSFSSNLVPATNSQPAQVSSRGFSSAVVNNPATGLPMIVSRTRTVSPGPVPNSSIVQDVTDRTTTRPSSSPQSGMHQQSNLTGDRPRRSMLPVRNIPQRSSGVLTDQTLTNQQTRPVNTSRTSGPRSSRGNRPVAQESSGVGGSGQPLLVASHIAVGQAVLPQLPAGAGPFHPSTVGARVRYAEANMVQLSPPAIPGTSGVQLAGTSGGQLAVEGRTPGASRNQTRPSSSQSGRATSLQGGGSSRSPTPLSRTVPRGTGGGSRIPSAGTSGGQLTPSNQSARGGGGESGSASGGRGNAQLVPIAVNNPDGSSRTIHVTQDVADSTVPVLVQVPKSPNSRNLAIRKLSKFFEAMANATTLEVFNNMYKHLTDDFRAQFHRQYPNHRPPPSQNSKATVTKPPTALEKLEADRLANENITNYLNSLAPKKPKASASEFEAIRQQQEAQKAIRIENERITNYAKNLIMVYDFTTTDGAAYYKLRKIDEWLVPTIPPYLPNPRRRIIR